jgi:hypothetical protein
MARDLIVRIIGDDKSLQAALLRDQKAVATFGTTTTSGLKRVDSAFSKTQRIAAGGFIGGAALAAGIAAIKSFTDAAAESQKILGQTQFALEQTGKSWADYGKQIESSVQAQSKLGFDDEALLQTFTQFLRVTGDVNKALSDNALARDIARGAHIDLERAAQVVNKAELGMAGAIRRLGIDTKGATTSAELLARLQEQFGGAAQSASEDASTAMDRFNVSVENVKESFGTLLLPAIADVADGLADAADDAAAFGTALGKLGSIKIPSIHIPLVADFGGGTIGGAVSKFGGEALKTAVKAQFLGVGLTVASTIKDAFADGVDKGLKQGTPELAAQFETSLNGMFKSALTAAAGNVKPEVFAPAIGFDRLPGVKTVADVIGKNIRAAIDEAQSQAADKVAKGTALIKADKAGKALDEAQAAAEEAARKRSEKFAKLLATLQLGVDRSLLTKALSDDLGPLELLKAGLEKQIRAGVDVQSAQAELVQVTGQIQAKQEEIRAQLADALQAKQFRALGLSGTGDEIVPGIDNLTKRLKGALGRIASGDLDVGSKLASRLKAAQKLIRTEGGKLTEETRRQIDAFLKAATGKDSKIDTEGPLTKGAGLNTKKILAGLGLDPDTVRELQSRLSHVNSSGLALAGNPRIPTGNFAGGQPIAVDSTVNVFLDGDQITRTVTRGQQVTKRRNPPQKRGPNRSGI